MQQNYCILRTVNSLLSYLQPLFGCTEAPFFTQHHPRMQYNVCKGMQEAPEDSTCPTCHIFDLALPPNSIIDLLEDLLDLLILLNSQKLISGLLSLLNGVHVAKIDCWKLAIPSSCQRFGFKPWFVLKSMPHLVCTHYHAIVLYLNNMDIDSTSWYQSRATTLFLHLLHFLSTHCP